MLIKTMVIKTLQKFSELLQCIDGTASSTDRIETLRNGGNGGSRFSMALLRFESELAFDDSGLLCGCSSKSTNGDAASSFRPN